MAWSARSAPPSGYRLYDEESIATLMRVRELTESGWSASEASRAILAGEVSVTSLAAGPRARSSDRGARGGRQAELIGRFLEAVDGHGQLGHRRCPRRAVRAGLVRVDRAMTCSCPRWPPSAPAWAEGRAGRGGGARGQRGRPPPALGALRGCGRHGRQRRGRRAAARRTPRAGRPGLRRGACDGSASVCSTSVRTCPVDQLGARRRSSIAHASSVLAVVLETEQDGGPRGRRGTAWRRASAPVVAVGGRSASWEGAHEAGIVVLPDRIARRPRRQRTAGSRDAAAR